MLRNSLATSLFLVVLIASGRTGLRPTSAAAEQPATRPVEPTKAQAKEADPADELVLRTFPSARAALRFVLRDKPAVLGIGEYHQTKGDAKVASALRRFTRRLLPLLRRRASDLLVETWVTDGNCGSAEKQVVKDVDETTERPAATEDEVVTLIKRARRYRIKPHILQLNCDDYRQLVDNEGVDYQRLLELTGERLRDKLLGIAKVRLDPIKRAVDDSLREAWGSGGGRNRDLVVVYGGAIHNDLHPAKETASFSYGPAIAQTAGPRYIEIDLVVPEYLTKDQALVRKQPWFPLFERHQSKRKALLIRQSKNSYVLVFRKAS